MQTTLSFSTSATPRAAQGPLDERTAQVTGPVELSLADLEKVAGGLAPNATWQTANQAPNSTW